ncbi:uncharacterized protein LOC112156007 [Oryzias melastigma]|uniref:uncharacterized protein LOC112156007 n=1 Tax=Oryzias melastigma TaxID=30732 RepID=UPI000CF7E6C3|nr:uncharacterized protein LOC112156007 [Oryzias melastigma]XP_024143884.1 uncharacterized protein LOC112156007 [Oryzias melastigma]
MWDEISDHVPSGKPLADTWKETMKWILQVIILSCAVLIPETSPTTYKAHENDNITIRWDTLSRSDLTNSSLVCVFLSKSSVLYKRVNGVESPDYLHQQFAERVQCDVDALREGRVVLHLSKVTAEDSGRYRCDLRDRYNTIQRRWETYMDETFLLNVTTASKDENRVLNSDLASAAGTEDPPIGRRRRRRANDPTGAGTLLAVVALAALILYGVYLILRSRF